MDRNLYCARFPWQMHRESKIQHMEQQYANAHIPPATQGVRDFEHPKCYRLRRVVFCAEVASALESALGSALESAVCVS